MTKPTDAPDIEPVPLACGWSCPPGYAPITCDGCGHIFGELKPVLKGSDEERPASCSFCPGFRLPEQHVRIDKPAYKPIDKPYKPWPL